MVPLSYSSSFVIHSIVRISKEKEGEREKQNQNQKQKQKQRQRRSGNLSVKRGILIGSKVGDISWKIGKAEQLLNSAIDDTTWHTRNHPRRTFKSQLKDHSSHSIDPAHPLSLTNYSLRPEQSSVGIDQREKM